MNVRRAVWLQLGLFLCFVVLAARLWWLQLIGVHTGGPGGGGIIEASVWQRAQGIILDSGRGHFLDRSLRPLTGDPYLTLVIFPYNGSEVQPEKIRRLAALLGIAPEDWRKQTSGMLSPSFWYRAGEKQPVRLARAEADAIDALGIPGVVVAPYLSRYFADAPAAQLVGYIGENPTLVSELYAQELEQGTMTLSSKLGASGLEKTFDAFLQAGEPTTLTAIVDGKGRLEEGGLRVYRPDHAFLPLNVVTTLDLDLQLALENVLDRHQVETGAAVILDARNGDILAMGSRPRFHPADVHPEESGWSNLALKAAIPGSIFKIVTAAAALEYGLVTEDEHFFCPGELGKYGLSCWKEGGHGSLTMAEAFAQSCNVAFAMIAERLTAEQITRTAHRLGLEQKIGWNGTWKGEAFRQLDGEEAGQIFAGQTDPNDGGVLAQTAIGQRDVRLTPLQAANMVLAVVNRGEAASPRAVRELQYRNGIRLKSYPPQTLIGEKDGISGETADKLKQWMREVVTGGTGWRLNSARTALAGKTGTAQVPHANGEGVNEWFVGFGPADDPEYVAAVMIYRTREESGHMATRVFGELMERLLDGGNGGLASAEQVE